jgi:hypothetical protein
MKFAVLVVAVASITSSAAYAIELKAFGPAHQADPGPSTVWDAYAISRNGRAFMLDRKDTPLRKNEMAARSKARFECENTSGYSCEAIATPSSWALPAFVHCVQRGKRHSFVAGSADDRAMDNAFGKAADAGFSRHSCKEATFAPPAFAEAH